MLISQLDPDELTISQVTRLLFSCVDDGQAGDCIIVPGSSKCVQYRVPVAVQLYLQGRAPKILFSGGRVWTERGEAKPEAVLMKEAALSSGVQSDAVLVEARSLHTAANAVESSRVLDVSIGLQNVSRLILVTTAYHMRRLHLTMLTHLPKQINYTCCPAQDVSTQMDNWWLTTKGTQRVRGEARKLINYVRQGKLVDLDI